MYSSWLLMIASTSGRSRLHKMPKKTRKACRDFSSFFCTPIGLKNETRSTVDFRCFFLWFIFSERFFSSMCCCQCELLYVLFRYFSILVSFNMSVHQVNVTKVDVSAEIELWQRSISHDRSKLNICTFDVYVYLYNIAYFVFVKSCFIILVTDILIY